MSSPREGGGRSGIGWGFWHFLKIIIIKIIIKIPTPGQRIIVKISRNKWFTSHLLFEIQRSNPWCPIKIPTLGIYVTVKFPWVARPPPPLGLDIDRNIIVTQRFVLFSQQESDRQQNTCVFLKRQNEQMQEDCDELNEQIQSLKVYNW